MARVATELMRTLKSSFDSWMPGVSKKMIWRTSSVYIQRTDFLVVCGRFETMPTFSSISALRKLDFPEFGRPTNAT